MIDNSSGKVVGRGGHTNNCNTLWVEEVFHGGTSKKLFRNSCNGSPRQQILTGGFSPVNS